MAERLRFRLPWMTSAPPRRAVEPTLPSPVLPPSSSDNTGSPQPPPPSRDADQPPPPPSRDADQPPPPPSRDADQPPPPSVAADQPPPPSVAADLPPPPSVAADLPPPPSVAADLPPTQTGATSSPRFPPPSDATGSPRPHPSDATAAKSDSLQPPPSDDIAAKSDSLQPSTLPKASSPQSPARPTARAKVPTSPLSSSRNGTPMRSPSRQFPKRENEIKSSLSSAESSKSISESNHVDAPKVLSPLSSLLVSNSKKEVQSPSSPLYWTDDSYSMFNSQDNDVDDSKALPPPPASSPLILNRDQEIESRSSYPLTRDSGDAPQFITEPKDAPLPPSRVSSDHPSPDPSGKHVSDNKAEITRLSSASFHNEEMPNTIPANESNSEIHLKEKKISCEPEKIMNEENLKNEGVEKFEGKENEYATKKREKQGTQKAIAQTRNSTFQSEIKGNVSELMSNISKKMAGEAPMSAVTLVGENTGAVMHLGSESSKQDGPVHIHRSYKTNHPANNEQREETMTQEELPNNTFVNSNSQSINNSILFGSTVQEKSPGVNLFYSYHLPSPSITNKSHLPTLKRRCLRGLFSDSTDSDSEQKKHGPRSYLPNKN